MKNKLLLSTIMMVFALATMAKDVKTVVFTTSPQMQCENCEQKIKNNIRFVKGVKSIETNVKGQTVTIKYDANKTSIDKIREGFTKLGYSVEEVNGNQKGSKGNCTNCKQKGNNKQKEANTCNKCKKTDKGENMQTNCCGNCKNGQPSMKENGKECADCKEKTANKMGEPNNGDNRQRK